MDQKYLDYLTTIELTPPIIGRIDELIGMSRIITEDPLLDIIVSEIISKDLTHTYESLWIITEKYMLEAKTFILKDYIDITPYRGLIHYASIEKESFDFIKPISSSRLSLNFSLTHLISGEVKGTGMNCLYIHKFYKNYILPNMIR